jgi:hypothetical protein
MPTTDKSNQAVAYSQKGNFVSNLFFLLDSTNFFRFCIFKLQNVQESLKICRKGFSKNASL